MADSQPSNSHDVIDAPSVKPALVDQQSKKTRKKKKGGLKWDEAKIQEHDLLRGTRMKIEEPDTPYHHYDSGSETDGSHNANKNQPQLSWDHLQNKLDAAAAVRDAYPSSPSSHGGGGLTDEEEEERKKKEMKALEFKEHRKRHYNEMELVRKFRQQHQDVDDDEDHDADGEDN